jgi:penicillin-binding protein 1A
LPTLPLALRLILFPIMLALGLVAMGIAIALIIVVLAYPKLPSLEVLTDYRPKIPLRIYTADGHLIGEFGEERRAVIAIGDVPPLMKKAILPRQSPSRLPGTSS